MQADYGVDLQFKSEQSLAAGFDGSEESRARLYLAEIGSEPVGMGALAPLTTDEVEIKTMYVRPSARGKASGRDFTVPLVVSFLVRRWRWND
jgi:hypothetical protein